MTKVKKSILIFAAVIFIILPLLSSCKKSEYVMKIGDYEISEAEYMYFWKNHRKAHSDYSNDEIKKLCENSLCEAYALWKMADDYEYSFDDKEESVESSYNEALEMYGGEDGFKKALATANMTEEVFKEEMRRQSLEINLRNYMMEEVSNCIKADDETVSNDISENFIRILQIYIANDDGESIEDNKALADNIYAQLTSGLSFEAAMSEYNEDESEPSDGYAFTQGQMLEDIEETVKTLNIGDISEVFTSDGGFHIIKRVELDDDYISKNFETLRYYYKCRVFNEIRSKTASDFKIEYTDLYDKLTLE